MKRLAMALMVVFCFTLFSMNSFAQETTTVEVSFKIGAPNYTVMGKSVKGEASYAVKGKTIVPLNIFTDALGATLTTDVKAKVATISYIGTDIKLTANKAEAIIAGKKVSIDTAPVIKNTSFMVSISFLADYLGADVTENKGTVTFIKEIANPNSIKDFGSLVKKTTKNKIGDSYYKWSMNLPDDLEILSRDFNGSENEFASKDSSYYVDVFIYDREKDYDLDNVVSNMQEYTEDYTLIDYGTFKTEDGIDYVKFIYSDDEWTYEKRTYLSDKREYVVTLFIPTVDDSYLKDSYQELIDSFQFNFIKDGNTEDLSDVSATGYRKYQDTKMKWTVNMHPDWEEIKDSDKQNKVVFEGKDYAFFSVEVYSLEKGETLNSIVEGVTQKYADEYDSSMVKISKVELGKLGGVPCQKVFYTIKMPKNNIYGCEIYVVDNNYKYKLESQLGEKDYTDMTQKRLTDGIINSFSFKELNTKITGKLLDPEKIKVSDKTRKISNDLYSLQLPINWDASEGNSKERSFYNNGDIGLQVFKLDYTGSIYTYIEEFDKKMATQEVKIDSKTILSQKGGAVYKYICNFVLDDAQYKQVVYLIQKDSKTYMVLFSVNNHKYGPKNIKLIENIWDSFVMN